jgi:hypothetical protein
LTGGVHEGTGNHANPTNCPNNNIIYANDGETLNQIGAGFGGKHLLQRSNRQ